MNKNFTYIANRLELRNPQKDSLEILANICSKITLKKNTDINDAQEIIKTDYKIFKEFEREFPSICFSIATGVGKTRLMGAFIAYLYKEKGIKDFFVLAPNITVYDKLISDFSDYNSPKYVFKGLADFISTPPTVVNGDNYEQYSTYAAQMGSSEVIINIFNIDKINKELKGGKELKMKKLCEYLGTSYFEYLVSKPDLVLLMDESHHYRAESGMKVINELNPVLGIELTATPQIEKSKGSEKFKNVVYEYSLAKAIKDGYVKEPAVATRRSIDTDEYSDEELDKIKIIDGIRIHNETKVEIDKYARDNKKRIVKPFILIVAKNTEHADKIKGFICSEECYGGYYKDKVMDIHSNKSGAEKEENIKQLITLEREDNKIEIVIHVNMLKEGWDVTNLYAIIPLRASASNTLTEQTIGRGLRLPYGKRTNNIVVDRLNIVSHDNYAKIIEEARKENSIIRKENIIDMDLNDGDNKPKEVITSNSKAEDEIFNQDNKIEDGVPYGTADNEIINGKETIKEINTAVYNAVIDLNKSVKNIKDLNKEEYVDMAINAAKNELQKQQSVIVDKEQFEPLLKNAYQNIIQSLIKNIIPIPKITIQQTVEIKWGFKDFDLNTKNFNFMPTDETIIIKNLRDEKVEILEMDSNTKEVDTLPNIILKELLEYPEVDYELFSEFLYKLINQAIYKFKTYLSEEEVAKVIVSNKKSIAELIYTQMKEHFYYETPDFESGQVIPYTKIEPNNLTKYVDEKEYSFRDNIEPKSDIPKKVFGGFKKSCHSLYKFDSNTEKLFAIVLEDDDIVVKWLRPAYRQFNIYWDRNREHLYEPDFIVETENNIFMVETKSKSDYVRAQKNPNDEVNLKANAGLEYCKKVSEYNLQNDGKEWRYILIPHDVIERQNGSVDWLSKCYEVKNEFQ